MPCQREVVFSQRAMLAALMSAAVLSIGAAPAVAPTRFLPPDTSVDFAHYTRPTQCLAAIARLRSDERKRRWWAMHASPDTMPWDPQAGFRPLPPAIVEAAQRCAAHWAPGTAPLTDFELVFPLFLDAGRDGDAAALLARRLAAVDARRGAAERATVLHAAIGMYLRAQPVRLAAAESLVTVRAGSTADRIARMGMYVQLAGGAAMVGDSARMRRAVQQVMAITDSLTPADRDLEAFHWAWGEFTVFAASTLVGGPPGALDSLRRSTAAYLKYIGATPGAARQRFPAGEIDPLIGTRAAPIMADFWFPSDSGHGPRPTPGRVALLVFLDHTRCVDHPPPSDGGFASGDKTHEGPDGSCWSAGVNLRRLAERFPALEITIVSQTHGYFSYGPPLSAAEEADYIARWVRGHAIPGTIAVSASPFQRLDDPDSRRIDQADSNAMHYAYARGSADNRFGKPWQAYVIDQDGVIVDWTTLGRGDNPAHGGFVRLSQEIDALLQRGGGGGARAGRSASPYRRATGWGP